jgi:hypothetical protein
VSEPFDTNEVFRQRGRRLLDLLQFCVLSVRMEPLFAYLVREYQIRPTMTRAIAIYDVFCAPQSPGRIQLPQALPPQNLRILQDIEPLRQRWREMRQRWEERQLSPSEPQEDEEVDPLAPILPPRYLFDAILTELESGSDNPVTGLGTLYDFDRSPLQNLPGGKLSGAQRQFVDFIWKPQLRPHLVSAGFSILASLG